MVISESVAVRHDDRIGLAGRCSEVAKEFRVRELQGLDVLRGVRIDQQLLAWIRGDLRMVFRRTKGDGGTLNLQSAGGSCSASPVDRTMELGEAHDSFEIPRFAPNARRVVVQIDAEPR